MYNFFPGGTQEMMAAVIADIDRWFVATIFAPLQCAYDPSAAVATMMQEVTRYFRSERRACLIGWTGLGSSRDVFASRVEGYFVRWISALAACLETGRVPVADASRLAEDAVSGIQGAIVLSRALDAAAFARIVNGHQTRLPDALARVGADAPAEGDEIAQPASLGR
jgi:TetR/AcrR family transcriptional regulator, lmrAB and yxaGH operons repressor